MCSAMFLMDGGSNNYGDHILYDAYSSLLK